MRLNHGFLKFISSLLVILMVWGCSNVSSLDTASLAGNNLGGRKNDYSIKANLPNPGFSSGNLETEKSQNFPNPQESIKPRDQAPKTPVKEKINFDKPELNYPDKSTIAPGLISIIYKNPYKVRVSKINKQVEAIENSDADKINKILQDYRVISLVSLMPQNADIDKFKAAQIKLSEDNNIDYPELDSMHCYKFPDDADTIKIAEELRKLPFVETAYPSPMAHTDSTPNPTFVARQTGSNIHSALPPYSNDSEFISYSQSETAIWYWYNKHKIFQTWDIYKSSFGNPADISQLSVLDLPTIAVVDEGFEKTTAVDAPPYITGVHLNSAGSYLDTNTSINTVWNNNNPLLRFSHGTAMANIIASPKNNSKGFCGIIPGARIYPIKIDYTYNSFNDSYYLSGPAIAAGISRAADQSYVDVINVSLSIQGNNSNEDRPISYDSQIYSSIDYATTVKKVVVISAGNKNTNLNTYSTPGNNGAIIVGGSGFDGKKWSDTTYEGSSSGYVIDLTAHAKDVFAWTMDIQYPANPTPTFHGNTGTSPATAIVSGVAAMMKKMSDSKGLFLLPREIRDVIARTGTLSITKPNITSLPTPATPPPPDAKTFLGRGLTDIDSAGNYNNVNLYAEMRDLNAWAALTVIKNSNYANLVRIFNNDDYAWATTNGDWNGRYTTENYFDESFWGFDALSSGTVLNFFTNNVGSNGSLGYQVYNNGRFSKERIYGVLSRYDTASYPNSTLLFDTVGPNTSGWFGGWNYP